MYLTKYIVIHKLDKFSSVMVNTITGAIDVVENRYLPYLKGSIELTPDIPIYQTLVDRGYLFNSKKDQDQKISLLFDRFSTCSRPTMFVICPTYSCNLRCSYCFEGKLTQKQPHILTVKEVDSIFKAIEELASEKPTIQLFGGEPLLPANKKIVTYIVEEAARRDFIISAVTNGVNFNTYIPLFSKHKDNLFDFQITLDGPADIHDSRRPRAGGQGSFDDIVRNIEMGLAEGFRIRVRVNVDRNNIDYLVKLADMFKTRGWDKLKNFGAHLSPVDEHTGKKLPHRLTEDETARLWLKMRRIHPQLSVFKSDLFRNLDYMITALQSDNPGFPRFYYCESNILGCYTFGSDRHIYPCAEGVGDLQTAVGTYHPKLSLDEKALNKWDNRTIMTIKKCRDCPVGTFCGGGCAYAALKINGSIDEPYCNNALETLHAYLESIKNELAIA